LTPPEEILAHFNLLMGTGVLWILLMLAVSIAYRRSKGKPVFPRKPDGCLYYEGMGSGHSNRYFYTKLGGARNCLMIALTPTELIVATRFPFNMMFLPEIYDLDHRIPRARILSVAADKFLWVKTVEIAFTDADGQSRSLTLYPKDADGFLKALDSRG
jgi:hypothetical protein